LGIVLVFEQTSFVHIADLIRDTWAADFSLEERSFSFDGTLPC